MRACACKRECKDASLIPANRRRRRGGFGDGESPASLATMRSVGGDACAASRRPASNECAFGADA